MLETLPHLFFYAFSALMLFSGLMAITQNNPVRSVLFLVVAFFGAALLWIMMNAEFLALILVLVYVGAVMTLFLFVVMMLNIDTESMRRHFMRYLPFGLILVALLSGLLLVAMPDTWKITADANGVLNAPEMSQIPNVNQIGMALFTQYVFSFELAAVLLLVAIVAAIMLTLRKAPRSKYQNIKQQIMTKKSDRLVILSMKSETKHIRSGGELES